MEEHQSIADKVLQEAGLAEAEQGHAQKQPFVSRGNANQPDPYSRIRNKINSLEAILIALLVLSITMGLAVMVIGYGVLAISLFIISGFSGLGLVMLAGFVFLVNSLWHMQYIQQTMQTHGKEQTKVSEGQTE